MCYKSCILYDIVNIGSNLFLNQIKDCINLLFDINNWIDIFIIKISKKKFWYYIITINIKQKLR